MKLMYGTVTQVFPPGTPQNINKYAYEYAVLATGDNFTQIPLFHVIRSDEFGAADDYNDVVLQTGQKVLVSCLKGYSDCSIIGAIRNTMTKQNKADGVYSRRRFNKIEQLIDKSFNYQVKSDSGPNLWVKTTEISLDDSVGEKIVLDKTNKVLTITANKWTVNIVGAADITVGGKATIKAASADVTTSGPTNVTASEANIKTSGKTNVEAGGKVIVKASVIELNGDAGKVVTTATFSNCFVTGAPIPGTGKVKAG